MKKFYVLIVALIIGATASVSALDLKSYPSDFKKGNIAINAGIGLPSFGYHGYITIPPVSASVDIAVPIADLPFSFGGFVGFMTSFSSYSYSDVGIYARGAYHFNFDVKGLDTYAGLMLGCEIRGTNDPVTPYPSGFSWGLYTGARYFLSPNVGAFAELGYGFTWITAGVTFKI
ncbi:MAG TPA: hypothetical protein PKO22_04900 [Treponemataceae bacterium]|nr:hypothetical protein [Treponemataceae bacterium]